MHMRRELRNVFADTQPWRRRKRNQGLKVPGLLPGSEVCGIQLLPNTLDAAYLFGKAAVMAKTVSRLSRACARGEPHCIPRYGEPLLPHAAEEFA
jgi:hypothetical protein